MSTSISFPSVSKAIQTLTDGGVTAADFQKLLGAGVFADIADAMYAGMLPTRVDLRRHLGLVMPIRRHNFEDLAQILAGAGYVVVEDEVDRYSLGLTEIDFSHVELVSMLHQGEKQITQAEWFRRLKTSGYVRLDGDIYSTWENDYRHLLPRKWKQKIEDGYTIRFDGTPIKAHGSTGTHYVTGLYFGGQDLIPVVEDYLADHHYLSAVVKP